MARNLLFSRLLLLLLAFLAPLAAAQLSIYTASDKYKYQGCYNETNDLPNTAHVRALSGGASRVMEGNMTVPLCLSFCSTGADKQYTYAGVEYSRECWCAQSISGLSVKLNDSQCNLPCDGNQGMVCGGALKLSVYMLSAGVRSPAASWAAAVVGALATYVLL
ncbi:WSC domain-containing protein [Colletotrichum orchidophilum]|uniref:WSC domain-containing protein n=1 Tax=Colletotrichum orchidophilum TaxID=1209926 RepID=A0A1G4BC11_9PEZI|nr:WSC domain-containing protein [Colletotrichum orchidophilum]OHE98928.1 WSC domain-containing protein [Colletotrichum orchidophilum]